MAPPKATKLAPIAAIASDPYAGARLVFFGIHDFLPAFLNIDGEHVQAAVLRLDLDHVAIIWIARTRNANDGPLGNDCSRGLAVAIVNRRRVTVQPQELPSPHSSPHAPGVGPNHYFIDGAENLVRPIRLPHDGEIGWRFFSGARNQDHGDGRKQVLDRISQIHSIHLPWDLNVGDQQVNFAGELLQNAESPDGVFRFENLNASTLKKELEVAAKGRLIVNDTVPEALSLSNE